MNVSIKLVLTIIILACICLDHVFSCAVRNGFKNDQNQTLKTSSTGAGDVPTTIQGRGMKSSHKSSHAYHKGLTRAKVSKFSKKKPVKHRRKAFVFRTMVDPKIIAGMGSEGAVHVDSNIINNLEESNDTSTFVEIPEESTTTTTHKKGGRHFLDKEESEKAEKSESVSDSESSLTSGDDLSSDKVDSIKVLENFEAVSTASESPVSPSVVNPEAEKSLENVDAVQVSVPLVNSAAVSNVSELPVDPNVVNPEAEKPLENVDAVSAPLVNAASVISSSDPSSSPAHMSTEPEKFSISPPNSGVDLSPEKVDEFQISPLLVNSAVILPSDPSGNPNLLLTEPEKLSDSSINRGDGDSSSEKVEAFILQEVSNPLINSAISSAPETPVDSIGNPNLSAEITDNVNLPSVPIITEPVVFPPAHFPQSYVQEKYQNPNPALINLNPPLALNDAETLPAAEIPLENSYPISQIEEPNKSHSKIINRLTTQSNTIRKSIHKKKHHKHKGHRKHSRYDDEKDIYYTKSDTYSYQTELDADGIQNDLYLQN